MGGPLRIEFTGACDHISSRGNGQRDIFKSRGDREWSFGHLESAVDRYGAVQALAPNLLKPGLVGGTLLSGVVFQLAGLTGCLWVSAGFLLTAGWLSLLLPRGELQMDA